VHDFLHLRRNARKLEQKDERIDSDLLLCADHIASDAWLLCFDEFHVKDVADAMILGRLFTALFDRGVVVVMTSNTAPDDLYADGLQRDRFLPFIALLKERLTVYSFDGDKDYRLGRLQGKKTYFWPSDDDARSELNRLFLSQADNDTGEPRVINLKGRTLKVPRQARGVAYFTFADLCAEQRSAVDYLELTKRYHAFVVEGIPVMALRFITLIDTLYDAGARLIASAAAPPEKLYHGETHAAAFQRTISRLNEMQAQSYNQGHGA
jgi:cell division protein ZapE